MTTKNSAEDLFKIMLDKLRQEKVEFNKTIDTRITALERAMEVFNGETPKTPSAPRAPRPRTRTVKRGRRGMRIDRQGGAKTYAFIKERGEKPTTIPMVSRKFNISSEAASQRVLNLYNDKKVVRIAKGQYVDADLVVKNGVSTRKPANDQATAQA